MIIEGPIITVISGFLVYLGFLNVYISFPLLVFGDLIGDYLHYIIGKYWGKSSGIKKIAAFLGYDENKEKILEKHFQNHKIKSILLAKISHGIGTIIQITAGMANVDLWSFLWYSFLGTVPKTFALFLLGFYLGSSYMKIDSYFDSIAIFFLVITFGFIIFSVVSKKFSKNLLKEEE
jgi:membrane-associated protein